MTTEEIPRSLEAEARTLFEADPSSKWEASWNNLASYKRWAWIDMVLIKRHREESLDTGPSTK